MIFPCLVSLEEALIIEEPAPLLEKGRALAAHFPPVAMVRAFPAE